MCVRCVCVCVCSDGGKRLSFMSSSRRAGSCEARDSSAVSLVIKRIT